MSLTQCPDCQRLCFVKAPSCPSCGRAFGTDELQRKTETEERAFRIKYTLLSLTALILLLASLTFFVLRDYMNGAGAFNTRMSILKVLPRRGDV